MAQSLQALRDLTAYIPAPVLSCCDCITERVQAIWNAIYLCIADYGSRLFTWCASWVSPAPEAPAEPPKKKTATELRRHYENTLMRLQKQNGSSISFCDYIESFSGPIYLGEELKFFARFLNEQHVLHVMANPRYTKADSNATADLLRLGADPDAVNMQGVTPLHCAVLTGCFLAYKTLREWRANPMLVASKPSGPGYDSFEPGTPIELAYQIQTSELGVDDFFLQIVVSEGRHYLTELFPKGLMARGKQDEVGTLADIDQMIAYEEGYQKEMVEKAAPIVGEVCGVPQPLAKIIAEMGKYYI